MRTRARENLQAARDLRTAGHSNAAANRLWYAVYHSGWFRLQEAGKGFGALNPLDKSDRYVHDTIYNNAWFLRKNRDDRRLATAVHALRVRADYRPDEPVLDGDLDERWSDALAMIREATK